MEWLQWSAPVSETRLMDRTARWLWVSERPSLVVLRSSLNVTGLAVLVWALASNVSVVGFDAISYWLVRLDDLYRGTSTSTAAGPFRYSPVLGQLIDPLGVLPWHIFYVGFLVASLLALVVLGGRWALALLLVPSVLGEIYLGNIDLFMAVSLGFGLVFPPAWVVLLLTKGTPAIVVLWFVVRREWRSLGAIVTVALIIALPSVLLMPNLWADWVRASTQYANSAYGASTIPVLPRLAVAGMVIIVGALRDWKWTIALAAVLAMPGLDWKTITIGLGVLPLYRLGLRADWPLMSRRWRPAAAAS